MSLTVLTTSPVWTAAGWTMLHLVWVGAVVGAAGGACATALQVGWSRNPTCVCLGLSGGAGGIAGRDFRLVFSSRRRATLRDMISPVDESARRTATSIRDLERVIPARLEISRPRPIPARVEAGDGGSNPWCLIFRRSGWPARCRRCCMLATGLIGVRAVEAIEPDHRERRDPASAACAGRFAGDRAASEHRHLRSPGRAGVDGDRPAADSAAAGCALRLERRAARDGLAPRTGTPAAVGQPGQPAAAGRGIAAVFSSGGLVAVGLGAAGARAVLRPARGRSAWSAACVCGDAGGLVRVKPPGASAVLAMADRQVLTRIRRLLNLEDRSMKLTMPEGLGLLGAVIVGASLVFGLQAAQPEPNG